MFKYFTPSNIYENPQPERPLPPPWYRPPPCVRKGPARAWASIIGGLVIPNDEGHGWYKEKQGYELSDDHSQDVNIMIRLRKLLDAKEIVLDCCSAPRRLESVVNDVLVITQIVQGPFVLDGPESHEEVYQEDRKPIPGVMEDEIKVQLKKEFETSVFKSYYSNRYY